MSLAVSRRDKIRLLLKRGWDSGQIAQKLAPDNPRKQKSIRHQVRTLISADEEAQTYLSASAHGALIEALPSITDALIRRAQRGRPDAIKLAYEASGFHNPKVDHRHTGDVKLTVHMPRAPVAELDSPPPAIEGTAVDVDS